MPTLMYVIVDNMTVNFHSLISGLMSEFQVTIYYDFFALVRIVHIIKKDIVTEKLP